MRKSVNESGITLIALVVTIVVLLILAGITITYVLADGGIFGKAQDAAKSQEMAVIRDYISNAQAELLIEAYDPSSTSTKTADKIMIANFPEGYSGTLLTAVADADDDGKIDAATKLTVTVPKTNNTYEVSFDSQGVATVSDPEATT